MTIEPWVIITVEQKKLGWEERVGTYRDGFHYRHRDYHVLKENADGTYTARNPLLEWTEEQFEDRR